MSAYVVSREHIDLMVAAGLGAVSDGRAISPDHAWNDLRWFAVDPSDEDWSYEDAVRKLDHTNADTVGSMLWTENVCSVSHRYPGDDSSSRPGPVSEDIDGEAIDYVFRSPAYRPTPVEVLKAIRCYEYQSCEHDGWRKSEAKAFCESLTLEMIHRLPGYDAAPWEWDSSEIAKARRVAA